MPRFFNPTPRQVRFAELVVRITETDLRSLDEQITRLDLSKDGEIFELCQRQKEFLDGRPRFSIRAWCAEDKRLNPKDPVTTREWREWEQEDGFMGWFEDHYPESADMSLTELKAAARAFYESTVMGMRRGDADRVRVYATMMARVPPGMIVGEAAVGPVVDDLMGWFNSGSGKRWTRSPVAEAK